MIIKSADDKQQSISTLEGLHKRPDITDAQREAIAKELKLLRAGMKGEAESAYLIDFDFKSSKNTAVIHDLRLEINGRVAQIDHLLVHRTLTVYVLETKHINSGMKITPIRRRIASLGILHLQCERSSPRTLGHRIGRSKWSFSWMVMSGLGLE